MRAGELRHSVTIQYRTLSRTDSERTATWSDGTTCWAAIEPLSGRELFRAQQTYPEMTHQVRIRAASYPALSGEHRIKFGTRYLYVLGVINVDERDRELRAMCVERTDE